MEITKEKFIETFKNECKKSEGNLRIESFKNYSGIEPNPFFELCLENNISFLVIRMTNKDDDKEIRSFYGKIIFKGLVEYKSFELTEEESLSMYNIFDESENIVRSFIKKRIITEGEIILAGILS